MINKDTAVIENSKGVLSDVYFAGLKKRLVAFALGFLIIFGYVLALLGIGISVTVTIGPLDQIHAIFTSPVFMDFAAFFVLVLPVT